MHKKVPHTCGKSSKGEIFSLRLLKIGLLVQVLHNLHPFWSKKLATETLENRERVKKFANVRECDIKFAHGVPPWGGGGWCGGSLEPAGVGVFWSGGDVATRRPSKWGDVA